MKLKYLQTLVEPENVFEKDEIDNSFLKMKSITALAISPNLNRLAACYSATNQVVLFDLSNNKSLGSFNLKPANKSENVKQFFVTGMAFSLDSEKIAIGQSDCVIYIYKVGDITVSKKALKNKFMLQTPISGLLWTQPGIIFSTFDGKVKCILTTNNKMFSIINAGNESVCVSLISNQEYVAAGFLSGKVMANKLSSTKDINSRQVMSHSCAPTTLILTNTSYLCVGGCDGKIMFQDISNSSCYFDAANESVVPSRSRSSLKKNLDHFPASMQTFELKEDITCGVASFSGTVIILATRDKLAIFELENSLWKQKSNFLLQGSYVITSICWSLDGTRLAIGTFNQAIMIFECRWKTKMFANRFEINYIGNRQVVIKDLESNKSSIFSSNQDIMKVKLFKETYTVIWTTNSLILASLIDNQQKSEIEWNGSAIKGIKFSFDYENVALLNAMGELYIVEYGQNKILGSVRTDFISPHLLSVRINERKSSSKVLACLLDAKTIVVIDLVTNLQMCTWMHTEKIDWIELNETGNKLIYRDKTLKLILLNILNQEFIVLLNFCGFVQWVPGSDVVVAQSRAKLFVWYDFNKPVIYEIDSGEGNEALEIKRQNGNTQVIFSISGSDITLDEVMLEFDTAINDDDLERAEFFLESLEANDRKLQMFNTNSLWLLLGNIALKKLNLSISGRAFAAIGDVAKVEFIKNCAQDSNMIALIDKDWDRFESNGDFDSILHIYLSTYNWEKALEFCKKMSRIDLVNEVERKYHNWLLETEQDSIAASILERKGDIEEAISLYLKSGRIFQITRLILNSFENKSKLNQEKQPKSLNIELIHKILNDLLTNELFEEAGDLYMIPVLADYQSALQNYILGKAFAKAITLARKHFPDKVVSLESKYGEHLMNEVSDPANAVNHFIEAGQSEKALEAAIQAKQFDRAAEIATILDHVPTYYGKKIGDYYASKDEIEQALEAYLNAGCIRDAVKLLNNKGQYARAYKIAKKLMDVAEAKEMYEFIAKSYEKEGKYKEAEKVYIACGDVDSAISMYKNTKQFESMIRLVKQYHTDLLNETCIYLAKELETEKQYKQAETYYISASEWKLASLMYTNVSLWEDAYRVSRAYGGTGAAKQVAFNWAQTMASPKEAVMLLNRYGLLNQVVDYAIETDNFEFALLLIENAGSDLKHKLTDVQLKYALWLENSGNYNEAELRFIEANKAKEAVIMYLHRNNFDEALRVAETHVQDEEVVKDILTAQARFLFQRSKEDATALSKIESLLLKAGRIEISIRMYREARMWNEAMRVCQQYAPHILDSLRHEMLTEMQENPNSINSFESFIPRDSMAKSEVVLHKQKQETGTVDLFELLKNAEQNDDKESIIRYTILLATQLLADHLAFDSLKVILKHDSTFVLPDSKKLLSRIAVIILSELEGFTLDETGESRIQVHSMVRDGIMQLITINSSLSNNEKRMFENYLLISHYLTLKSIFESIVNSNDVKSGSNIAKELHFKLCISLLRYTDILRVDKVFYEAGMAARNQKRLEMAFVFLNHFLDILDAIEDHDYNIDHSDFVGTDIPFEVPLPQKTFYNQQVIEEIKGWILQTSMNTEVSQTLPLDPLRDGEIYEASLINSDSSRCLPCLITGYPVIRHKMIEFKPDKYAVNKEDWNKLLMLSKINENTQLKEVLHFIGRICGNNAIVKFTFQ